jgi:hypothetical protein
MVSALQITGCAACGEHKGVFIYLRAGTFTLASDVELPGRALGPLTRAQVEDLVESLQTILQLTRPAGATASNTEQADCAGAQHASADLPPAEIEGAGI